MELPASEIEFWRHYYSIFPLPQERADFRAALLAERITNMIAMQIAGRKARTHKVDDFMPDYLGKTNPAEKSIEAQAEADKAFGAALIAIKAQVSSQ